MRYFLILLFSVSLSAQVPPTPTEYDLDITGAASSTYTFLASTVTCNAASEPGTPGAINPRYLVWNDEANPGRFCFHDTGANTGPLFALPIGDFQARLFAVVATATARLRSEASDPANFSRLAQPAARTGFRVRGA